MEKDTSSHFRLSPTISLEMSLILSSPASEMPEDLSHLKKAVIYDCCYVLPIVCIPSRKW